MVTDHISIGDFLSSGDFCFMDECNGVGTSDSPTPLARQLNSLLSALCQIDAVGPAIRVSMVSKVSQLLDCRCDLLLGLRTDLVQGNGQLRHA